jgi:hypothetical protein
MNTSNTLSPEDRAAALDIAQAFGTIPTVIAVALAGSLTSSFSDIKSDFDFYVYAKPDIPIDARESITRRLGKPEPIEINNQFWETGDEWIDARTGRGVDITYRWPDWIEEQLGRVIDQHQASTGYTTCFWYNINVSEALYDPSGWFAKIKARADQPYPEPLRRAIIAKNYPILRKNISSYSHQLDKAIARRDLISINHRIAALMASYFDILFAVNRVLHPGEKRLLDFTVRYCSNLPEHIEADVRELLDAAAMPRRIPSAIDTLVDHLDMLLVTEGLLLT